MTTDFPIPPLRDLPAGQLAARKAQLLNEIRAEQHRRLLSGLGGQRRLALVLAAIIGVGILFATPAFGLRGVIGDLFGRNDVEFSEAPPAASVIKRDFAEMSLGAPAGMDPKAIEGETRLVGNFDFGSGKRRVWVAPTATGSFCYTFEGISGGCASPDASDSLTFDGGFVARRGAPPAADQIAGRIFDPAASSLEIEFEDARKLTLPFVYVSQPINVGFYLYKPTATEQSQGHRPTRIVLFDRAGTEIAAETFDWAEQAERAERLKDVFNQPAQLLPSEPPIAPSEPLLQAGASGATVTVGSNGAAIFDISALSPEVAEIVGDAATFSCYRVTEPRSGTLKWHQFGHSGRHSGIVGLRLFKQGRVDACDVSASIGRTWPDKLGSRAPVEFAFNDLGRRWLSDRAAARDLALFLRSNQVRDLRRQPMAELMEGLRGYGERVVELPAGSDPSADKIGFTLTGDGVTFTRMSESGKRFTVEIKAGKVAEHNLGELARIR